MMKLIKNKHRAHQGDTKAQQNGFTTIELALVIIISGFVVIAVSNLFGLYRQSAATTQTQTALRTSETAISEFRFYNGRYPCPANPQRGPGDAGYGREDCSLPASLTGRDANGDGAPDGVIIGAVPFQTLLDEENPAFVAIRDTPLSESLTVDGWGNKLTYAVTANLTDDSTFQEDWGAIRVTDEHNQSVSEVDGGNHFVILSHGENGRGAYNRSGALVQTCSLSITGPPDPDAPPVNARSEIDNCNGTATFVAGLINQTEGSYFDDIVRFVATTSSNLWTFVGMDLDTGTWQVTNTNPGFVGIGIDNPAVPLHVIGNIAAEEVHAQLLCDSGGTNCLDPNALGGDIPDMNCAPGGGGINAGPNRAVIAIRENRVVCGEVFTGPGPGGTCPAGQLMTGISNLGNVRCATP